MRAVLLLLLCGVDAFAQTGNAEASVREAYQSGEQAIREGDLANAEKWFLRVLELVPQDVGARVNLGVIFMREQNWPRALEYLSQAEQLAPQVPGIHLNMGLLRYRQDKYGAAIPEFQAALKGQPDSLQTRRLLGLCYLFEERYTEAATELEPLWNVSNGDLSYLYSLSVAAGNSGRHNLEERALTRLTELGKDSPLMHLLLGKAYIAHQDDEHALAEFRMAAAADPKLPLLHYNLGIVYRHLGQLETARAEFLEDVAIEPGVAFNYDQLGLLSSQQHSIPQAEAYFKDAVQRDPRLGTSWFGLAKLYKEQDSFPEALTALDKAGALDPKSASVHYLRAQVLTALKRNNEAQAEFAIVQKLKKETVDALEAEISGARYRDPNIVTPPQ
jgi:tetratricopeptide (TPR) repeat protein